MHQRNDLRSKWVRKQAAKHTTPESIRQRIADENKKIRLLSDSGVTSDSMAEALENHHELIRVLTKRLADFA
ncbi:hypothetical protein ILT44_27910 [Microvirga sp. BT689]|uniref:hypothetical protein n=1 Tax=Microvirga arvi TaxID=2778731 RepID=UPI00194EC1CB|nr:hypothetical protein [Microvirga arvi]MBM6584030.1 hypothetical protein [Microvirga arvi]